MIKFITAGLVIILRLYQYSYARWIHCIYKTLQNIRVLQKRVYSKGIRHKIKIRNAHVKHKYKIVVVKLLSSVRPFVTPWTAAHQASLSFTNSRSLGKLMSIELMMPSNRLILCCLLPAFSLSQHQGLFQWVSSSHQVARVLERRIPVL